MDNFVAVDLPSGNCSSFKGANLTGVRRKIKDNSADLHNSIQTWNKLVIQGAEILKEITDRKCKYTTEDEDRMYQGEHLMDVRKASPSSKLVTELSDLCDQLQVVIENLETAVGKMLKIWKQLEHCSNLDQSQREVSCRDLSDSNFSDASSYLEPLFQTWQTEKFVEVSKEIYEMYSKDMKIKRSILEEVAFLTHHDQLVFYTAAWLHQPHIEEDRVKLMLESMLVEVGHR